MARPYMSCGRVSFVPLARRASEGGDPGIAESIAIPYPSKSPSLARRARAVIGLM